MEFRVQDFHLLWLNFPDYSAIPYGIISRSRNPRMQALWFRLLRFRSPLLTESLCFLFLRLLRCFTSPGLALKPYIFRLQCLDMTRDGFPHSEISGSKRVCHYPKLIAAYHVLHRLLMPRHPLCALSNLTKIPYSLVKTNTIGSNIFQPDTLHI